MEIEKTIPQFTVDPELELRIGVRVRGRFANVDLVRLQSLLSIRLLEEIEQSENRYLTTGRKRNSIALPIAPMGFRIHRDDNDIVIIELLPPNRQRSVFDLLK